MTTVINNPGGGDDSGVGLAAIVITAIVVVGLLYVFVLPAVLDREDSKQNEGSLDVNLKMPSPTPSPSTQ